MIWRCAGDFFRVLLKFKINPTGQLHFLCGHKNSHSTITLPMILRCTGVFFKVLLKFKMAATDQQIVKNKNALISLTLTARGSTLDVRI